MLCKAIIPRQTCSKWGFREGSSEARRIRLRPEGEEAMVKAEGSLSYRGRGGEDREVGKGQECSWRSSGCVVGEGEGRGEGREFSRARS